MPSSRPWPGCSAGWRRHDRALARRAGVAMRREHAQVGWEGFSGSVLAYGHYGRPMLVFASEQGRAEDFENNGMVDAVAGLIEAGRLKLYCIDSADGYSWSDYGVPIEERARRHGRFESWVIEQVVPWM